jgi:putative pyruvate formate lyase activating enzyme
MVSSARKLELVGKALDRLSPLETSCTLCPRDCRTDRTKGAGGVCQTGSLAAVSHALLHFGEEPVVSGRSGSGTVFFTGCNLKCLFCQNYQLSWLLEGSAVTDRELAAMMLGLRDKGAHNINFVSPSHVVLPILRALRIALAEGLDIPLVWNSNGYDSVEVVRALEGIVDVYLPDLKYRSPALSKKYSAAPDYFDKASEAVREMSLQQPALELGPGGTARRGLVVRHLILPGAVGDTLELLDWIGANLSPFIGLSLMSQYHPCFKAPEEIRRSVSADEYRRAAAKAVALGLDHLFLQPEPFGADEHLVPDFRKDSPFRWK